MEIRKVEFSQKQGRRQMGKWPAVLSEYLESGFDSAEVFPDSSDAGFTRHAATLAYIGIRNAIERNGINGIYVSKQGNRIFITRERKD